MTWAVCPHVSSIEGNFIPYFIASIFVAIYARSDGQSQQSAGHHILTAAAVPLIPGRKPVLYYGRSRKRRRVYVAESGSAAVTIAPGYFPGVCSSIRHHQIYKSFPGQKSPVITFPKK